MSALVHAAEELVAHPVRPPTPVEALERRARALRRHRAIQMGIVVAVVLVCGAGVARVLATPNADRGGRVVAGVGDSVVSGSRTWAKGPSPAMSAARIAQTPSGTYVLGTNTSFAPAIWKQAADRSPTLTEIFSGTADRRTYLNGPQPRVSDLAQQGSRLVAVGQGYQRDGDREGAAVWRSTDSGRTWHSATVQQPREFSEPVPTGVTVPSSTINRVLQADGVWYAFGGSWASRDSSAGVYPTSCRPLVWTSSDGWRWSLAETAPTNSCTSFVDASTGPAGLIALVYRDGAAIGSGEVWQATNGRWAPQPISGDPLHEVTGLASSPDRYVVVGASNGDGAIWTSPDARAWKRVATVRPPKPLGTPQATFTGIARGATGWLAVGWKSHPGLGEPFTDAVVWTSHDGTAWNPAVGDGFAYARAGAVGATNRGFMIAGESNVRGEGSSERPIRTDPTIWVSRRGY